MLKYTVFYDIPYGTRQQAGPTSALVVSGERGLCSRTLHSVFLFLSLSLPSLTFLAPRDAAHGHIETGIMMTESKYWSLKPLNSKLAITSDERN